MVALDRNVISKQTNKGKALEDLEDRIVLLETAVDSPVVKALVDNTLTVLFTKSLADGDAVGGFVDYKVKATDGVDTQSVKGRLQWSAVRKGATISFTLGPPAQIIAQSDNTKTLDVTFSAAQAAGVFSFKVTVDSSLVVTAESISYTRQDF